MWIEVVTKNEYVRRPRYGDIVCWTEGDHKDEPLLVTYYGLVSLKNPKDTFSGEYMDMGECLDWTFDMLKCGKLRYMEEVERIIIHNT